MSAPNTASQVQYIRSPLVTTATLPETNRENRRMKITGPSRSVEVEELRHGVQFLFEQHHALVFEDVADLAVGIEQVAEFPRAGRARFDTRRIPARARALDAPRALLHHPSRPRPVPEVVHLRVDACRGHLRQASTRRCT